jgi:probable F420-dependent oxidoreductase
MTGICINLSHMQDWFAGDFSAVIPLIRLADELGLDQVSLAEHLLISEAGAANYPYGDYYQALTDPWPEPIVYLSLLAGVTHRIELSTGILIAPLRPAPLLAKQLATLDLLSRGRLVAGLGVGWQLEEYEACNMNWDGRFKRLEEQILACRTLWRDTPASFEGRTERFRDVYAMPKPARPGGIPIWLGLGLGEHNLRRVVELADGWLPLETDPDKLAPEIDRLRQACVAGGRDPATLSIRATVMPADFTTMQAVALKLVAAGVSMLQFYPASCCAGPDECARLFEDLLALRDMINGET